jgi:dihydrofolate reductase
MKNHKVKIPPGINPKKVRSEAESRKNILKDARIAGLEEKILKCFARYDKMLEECKTEEEQKQIAIMGSAEIYRIFGLKSGLNVDGVDIIPKDIGEKSKEDN